jgi:hypothetical protein
MLLPLASVPGTSVQVGSVNQLSALVHFSGNGSLQVVLRLPHITIGTTLRICCRGGLGPAVAVAPIVVVSVHDLDEYLLWKGRW